MITVPAKAAALGRLIGWGAVAASLGFIGHQLWRQAPWQLAATHLQSLAAAILAGALLYGLAGFLLSSAWHHLLGGERSWPSLRRHHAVYGRTQIAKYLPGNVFHLVGRQVLGRQLGHGQALLALASVLEAGLLLLVAGTLSLPVLLPWLGGSWWILAVAAAPALIIARWLYRRQRRALSELAAGARGSQVPAVLSMALRVLRPLCLYTVFFLMVAAILWMLAMSVGDPDRPSIGLVGSVGAVALAWLIGFATPGSSAGIGVREAVLIATLEGTLGVPVSALVALALRLVSIGGDVVFLGLSSMLAPTRGWSKPDATVVPLDAG